VLIIEDEAKIRDAVRDAMAAVSHRCIGASTGAQGLALAASHRPDFVVLDLGLPDIDGLEVCRRLREHCNSPILVLSARHSERDKVALLDAGADDYMTKPFGSDELRARISAQLRRARMPTAVHGDGPLVFGDLVVDVARRTVVRGTVSKHLSPTEWALLMTLVRNPGRTLTHSQLFRAVWGKAFGQPQQYLRVYITHLRKKVEVSAFTPRLIVTEPGVGYRFESDG
jgi:two-component system KDP operon response regulator KdpE